jgi:hypothetical protein
MQEKAQLNLKLEPVPAPHARKLAAAPPLPRPPPPPPPPGAGVIGMIIRHIEGDPAAGTAVHELTPGKPAAACGQIKVGDRLLAVDGRAVAGMGLSAIHGLINGPAGQSLRLQFVQPRGGGGGGGGGSSTPRDGNGDVLGALSSACYTIASSGGGGGGSAATTPRPSEEQSRVGRPAVRAGGAVYEVELVRAALEVPVE